MYQVRLANRAERDLRRLRRGDPPGYRRVLAALRSLAREPRPGGATKLAGVDPPPWRVRVGGYRIVYEVHDAELVVLIIRAARRGEVYR